MNALRFRLAGFPVEVLPNALLLGAMFFLFGLSWGWSLPLIGATIAVAFGSVLFHEMGHALSAKAFGLGPISIQLHGFGGLTRHRAPTKAWKELLIVLAGPTFGLLLAALGTVALLAPWTPPELVREALEQLVFLNIFWSVFNLLPVFPLDGGHALSAMLQMVVSPSVAHPVTFGVGLVGSIGMGLFALTQGYILMLFFAGSFAWQNFELLRARRHAAAGH